MAHMWRSEDGVFGRIIFLLLPLHGLQVSGHQTWVANTFTCGATLLAQSSISLYQLFSLSLPPFLSLPPSLPLHVSPVQTHRLIKLWDGLAV